jgi:hypothetical protein
MESVKVPASVIYRLKLEIGNVEKAIARKQKRLKELRAALARLEKL